MFPKGHILLVKSVLAVGIRCFKSIRSFENEQKVRLKKSKNSLTFLSVVLSMLVMLSRSESRLPDACPSLDMSGLWDSSYIERLPPTDSLALSFVGLGFLLRPLSKDPRTKVSKTVQDDLTAFLKISKLFLETVISALTVVSSASMLCGKPNKLALMPSGF